MLLGVCGRRLLLLLLLLLLAAAGWHPLLLAAGGGCVLLLLGHRRCLGLHAMHTSAKSPRTLKGETQCDSCA